MPFSVRTIADILENETTSDIIQLYNNYVRFVSDDWNTEMLYFVHDQSSLQVFTSNYNNEHLHVSVWDANLRYPPVALNNIISSTIKDINKTNAWVAHGLAPLQIPHMEQFYDTLNKDPRVDCVYRYSFGTRFMLENEFLFTTGNREHYVGIIVKSSDSVHQDVICCIREDGYHMYIEYMSISSRVDHKLLLELTNKLMNIKLTPYMYGYELHHDNIIG